MLTRLQTTVLTTAAFCLFQLACVKATPTVYSPAPLTGVRTWDIGFAYESGAQAETTDNSGRQATTVVRSGQSIRNLQLRDNIYFALQDKYRVAVTKNGTTNGGTIKLVPVDFLDGGFKSLDVRFEDQNGTLLARLQIKNSDRNCCFKNDDKFAAYSAEKIAELLGSKAP